MRLFSLLLTLLFITGCTTVEFVRKETKPQKQAVLRYIPTDDERKEEKYREKVARKASNFCGGANYAITREYQAREPTGYTTGVGSGMAVGMGGVFLGGSNASTRMYNFVEFTCTTSAPPVESDAAQKAL